MLKLQEENKHRELQEGEIQECLDEIYKHANNPDREALLAGLEILHKLIGNIIDNPREDKYKTLKTTNKTIQAKIMTIQPYQRLILLL